MKYTLKISRIFAEDVDKTYAYIKEVLSNENAANNLKKDINDKILLIKKIPNNGSILYNLNNEETVFMYMRVKKYFIFYRVFKENIYIHRLIYQGREYIKILNIQ